MTEDYINEFKTYQLVPAPPKWDLQEYIVTYLKEQNTRYLAWFLHYYENTVNRNVRRYMQKFFMPEYFEDMKQAYVEGLFKALKNYDGSQGVPFVFFKEPYVKREILNYIRSARTGFTAQSLSEYAKLRKAVAIWEKYGRSYSDEALMKTSDELGESVDNVKEILLGGLLNENRTNMYRRYIDHDGEEAAEEILSDDSSETSHLYMKTELYTKLMEAYEKLEYTERVMLAQRLGFCPECYSVYYMDTEDLDEHGVPKKKLIKPMMFTDIATDHGLSSANTAHNAYMRALEELRKSIVVFI